MEKLTRDDFLMALADLHPNGYEWPQGYAGPLPGNTYEQFAAAYGKDAPSEHEVIAARDRMLASIETRDAMRSARDDLRAWWESEAVPPYVRGPFQDGFDTASKLLDKGDVESAIARLRYAKPIDDYSVEEAAEFDRVKTHIVGALETLTQPS